MSHRTTVPTVDRVLIVVLCRHFQQQYLPQIVPMHCYRFLFQKHECVLDLRESERERERGQSER